jgi:TIR domain-containing protein
LTDETALSSKHYLPSKIGSYFKRLELEYARTDHTRLLEIINTARVEIVEETSYDNWNGGTYGHDVILYLPAEVIGELGFEWQKQLGNTICEDLNKCAGSVNNESFRAVHLELADEADPGYQRAVGLSQQPQTNPDTLSFWKPGHLRLFISHRDKHKAAARELGDALSKYGISAFVAHDTIVPMKTWQHEIEKGLETMEVMLAFVTDDFHESTWTNQEVGYALGKNVPVVSVKFESKSPAGFIGSKQALKGDLEHPDRLAPAIYKLLVESLGQKGRLRLTLITAFCDSPDFNETRDRFNRLAETISTLSDDEVEQIQKAYASNDQLHGAYYLGYYNRLISFMKRCTGKEFAIDGKKLVGESAKATKKEMDDEIPF